MSRILLYLWPDGRSNPPQAGNRSADDGRGFARPAKLLSVERQDEVRSGRLIELFRLKALAVVVLLFIGVYVPAFVVTALIKPRPQVAIPLVIGISLAIALVFIFFLSSDGAGFAEFGFKAASYRQLAAAAALGVPIGLGLTLLVSRFNAPNPFGEVSLRPWMIFFYFIVGTPVQEEVIFRGLLQTTLERRMAGSFSFLGVTLSFGVISIAVLFGLIHLAVGALTAIAAFVLGLLAGELRRRSSSLLPAIMLHAIFNTFSAMW